MKNKYLLLIPVAIFLAVFGCKKDTEVNKDTFKIENEQVEATTQSVAIEGSYSYAGAIDAITLEMGRQRDLMDGDAYRTLLEGTGYSVEVKNLRTNTTYYYRYAVEYGSKEPYRTEIKSFSTLEYNLPEVNSNEVVSVGVNNAEVSGEVLGDGGGDAVTLRGICWSMSHNPSVGDEYANAGEGIGTFTCELTNLQAEKTYYARAFAGNSKGVAYGEELTFVTLAAGSLAEVRTVGISGNAMLQAMVSGEVMNEGASSVIERGVCYSKEHYPTASGLHVASGMGAGEYTCQLTNLEANTTYYVRAYAINSLGIAYGEEMSFVAQTETTTPVVVTQMVNGITQTSATGHGMVVSDGGAAVTRRGLCWSAAPNPTVDGSHADCGTGVGEFSGLMPRLTDMTTYYVRAYAENAVGVAYGDEVSFTVGQHEHPGLPSVTTAEVTNISTTTAVGGGNVANDGGAEVTERGICWSTSSNPTISDNHASNGTGTGTYTCMMTDLTPGTTYYVRAYAINENGLSYGHVVVFVTSGLQQYTITATPNPLEGGTVTIDYNSKSYNNATALTQDNYLVSPQVTLGGTVTSRAKAQDVNYAAEHRGVTISTTNATSASAFTTIQERTLPARGDTCVLTGYDYLTICSDQLPYVFHWHVFAESGSYDLIVPGVAANGCDSLWHLTLTAHPTYEVNDFHTFCQGEIYMWEGHAYGATAGSFTDTEILMTVAGCDSIIHMLVTVNPSYEVNDNHTLSQGNTYIWQGHTYGATAGTFTDTEMLTSVAGCDSIVHMTVTVNPAPMGETVSATFDEGQTCVLTATPFEGYHFVNWTENGTVVSTDAVYSFTVIGNRTLIANFSN